MSFFHLRINVTGKQFIFLFYSYIYSPNLEQFLVLVGPQINIHCRNEFTELYIYLRINRKTLENQIILFHPPEENALYSKVFIEHKIILIPKSIQKQKHFCNSFQIQNSFAFYCNTFILVCLVSLHLPLLLLLWFYKHRLWLE